MGGRMDGSMVRFGCVDGWVSFGWIDGWTHDG